MLNEDGTITFQMESANGNEANVGLAVTLRRPRLEELFSMWEAVDRISASEEPKPKRKPKGTTTQVGETVKTKPGEPEPDEPEPELPRGAAVLATMRQNLRWTRTAIATLGPAGLYEPDGADNYKLANVALAEPPWFINGQLAAQWLRHWQDVPLDLGAPATA